MNTFVTLSKICDFVIDNDYSKIIFVGLPHYLPFVSRVLPNKVNWWSMKYKLDVFPEVKVKFYHLKDGQNDKFTVGNSIYYLSTGNPYFDNKQEAQLFLNKMVDK